MCWWRGEVGHSRLPGRIGLYPPDSLDIIAVANLDVRHPVVARCDMRHLLKKITMQYTQYKKQKLRLVLLEAKPTGL